MNRDRLALLVRAWLLIAAIDGTFASALSVFAYHSTVARLWQGVASTLLGPDAFTGGTRTALVGVLMHLGVALAWTTVFYALATSVPRIRRAAATPGGAAAVAAVYGPFVWLVMSLAVVPLLTGRAPTFTVRWWVQLLGHIPFVALPIVTAIGLGLRGDEASDRSLHQTRLSTRRT